MQGDTASKQYLKLKVNPIFEKMIVELVLKKPDNVTKFMIKWLTENGEQIESKGIQLSKQQQKQLANYIVESESDEDEITDNFVDIVEVKNKSKKISRQSVSQEAYGVYLKKSVFVAKVNKKSPEINKHIKEVLNRTFMFSNLEQNEQDIVIDAMLECKFQDQEKVIEQGDDGDVLYLIDQGKLDCFKQFEKNGEFKFLKTYGPGEIFGELALLYNAPRAARIVSKGVSTLFSLDRETFNHIVKDAASKKRQRYEDFLSKVEILQDIDAYERLQIADAIKTVKFRKGEYVCKEGEVGSTFYFLEEGQATATKVLEPGQPPVEVFTYKPGDYFGEIALLKSDSKRAANVIATTDISVCALDQNSFKRLIGPLEDILRRNFSRYEKFMG